MPLVAIEIVGSVGNGGKGIAGGGEGSEATDADFLRFELIDSGLSVTLVGGD